MSNKVKVKICGLTIPEQAREIAELGADYIGCIIEFPKSLRSVSAERAREIRHEISTYRNIALVGVVVDLPFDRLTALINETGIRIWQLHGNEDKEYVKRVKEMGVEVEVWKVMRNATKGHPEQSEGSRPHGRTVGASLDSSPTLRMTKYIDKIVVDAKNPVHGAGGSGILSDWDLARQLVDEGYDVVLSGGLSPDNVQEGITFVRSSIVDTSSGVEASPGIKDLTKVERFLKNAKAI